MTSSLLIITAFIFSLSELRVETLDSPPAKSSAIESIDEKVIRLKGDASDSEIPLANLLRIKASNRTVAKLTAPWIELYDGSVLPIVSYEVNGTKAKIQFAGQGKSILLPLKSIRLVRLKSRTPQIDVQWDEIRKTNPAGDLVVIRKGTAIDYLEGVLGKVTKDEVMFSLDGDEIGVPISKLDGLYYYRKKTTGPNSNTAILSTTNGTRIITKKVRIREGRLYAQLTNGIELDFSMDEFVELDYSRGKMRYLADERPIRVQKTTIIDWPSSVQIASNVQGPVFNRGFFTAKMLLPSNNSKKSNSLQESQVFHRGIGLRPKTEIEYRIPKKFHRLKSLVGIDSKISNHGSVRLTVYGDDELLFDQVILAGNAPVALNLNLENKRTVKFVVDDADDGDSGDRLYLCNVRFTK